MLKRRRQAQSAAVPADAPGPQKAGAANPQSWRARMLRRDEPGAAKGCSWRRRANLPAYWVGGRAKSTLGATLADSGTWNRGYSLKLKIPAVMFAGNCRRAVLYSCTRSL